MSTHEDIDARLSALEARLDNPTMPPIGTGTSFEQHIANLECNGDMAAGAWRDVIDAGAKVEQRLSALEASVNAGRCNEITTEISQRHVVPCGRGWAVMESGAKRVSDITETKEEAIKIGRIISERQGCQLVVHDENVQIQSSEASSTNTTAQTKRAEVAERFIAAAKDRNGTPCNYLWVSLRLQMLEELLAKQEINAYELRAMAAVLEEAAREERDA